MLGNAARFKSETQNALGQVLSFSTATNKWTLHKSVPIPKPRRRLSVQEGMGVRLQFTSQAMDLWAYQNGMKIDFSRPGKPTDNAFMETFNGTFRAECLDTHWFADLKEAKHLIESWRREFNESRPHASLKDMTPSEFASESAASRALTAT